MSFNDIPKVETSDFYIDMAFGRAKKDSFSLRSTKIEGGKIDVMKRVELVKISSIKNLLDKHLSAIVKSFPSVDHLDEFYVSLMRCYFSVEDFRKALSSVNWTVGKLSEFHGEYSVKIKRSRTVDDVVRHKNAFYGRISSLIKRLKVHLEFLEFARKDMRDFPVIKTKLFTVALFGFPNVGKTTLLSRLSGSTPEISNYAFTTKKINVSYVDINGEKVQLLDTPGSLNRFEKMNFIEKQAFLALKYCTHVIVFVFDMSESSYPIQDQLKLFRSLKDFDKPVIVYLSKTDLVDGFEEKARSLDIEEFFSDADSLKKEIAKKFY